MNYTTHVAAMLVLTTMFINVSNNLPKTSYVKMIDIWLIFNLLLPFIEVLVHSYMDTLRRPPYLCHSMWEKASLKCKTGTTMIARSTTMDVALKLARQKQMRRKMILFFSKTSITPTPPPLPPSFRLV